MDGETRVHIEEGTEWKEESERASPGLCLWRTMTGKNGPSERAVCRMRICDPGVVTRSYPVAIMVSLELTADLSKGQ